MLSREGLDLLRPGVKSYSPPMKHDRPPRVTMTCPNCQCKHASSAEFELCKQWYKATELGAPAPRNEATPS